MLILDLSHIYLLNEVMKFNTSQCLYKTIINYLFY